jgi:hypothetical protein
MKPTLLGRADLIRVMALRDPALLASVAGTLGYQEISLPAPHPEPRACS